MLVSQVALTLARLPPRFNLQVMRMREEADGAIGEVEARLAEEQAAFAAASAAAEEEAKASIAQAAEAAAATARAAAKHEHEETMRSKLGELTTEVGALAAVLKHDTRYKQVSHATHQLAALVQSIQAGLHAKPPVRALQALPALADRLDDELLKEAFAPLRAKGGAQALATAPTLAELAARFKDVAAAGRVAALVPDAAPGLWGHALAAATSALTLRAAESGHTAASTALAVADGALLRGDLRGAVAAVRALEGAPARAASGWLEAAERRLLLQTMLTVATAESTIATAALAPF
jgi:hypothetical protein